MSSETNFETPSKQAKTHKHQPLPQINVLSPRLQWIQGLSGEVLVVGGFGRQLVVWEDLAEVSVIICWSNIVIQIFFNGHFRKMGCSYILPLVSILALEEKLKQVVKTWIYLLVVYFYKAMYPGSK